MIIIENLVKQFGDKRVLDQVCMDVAQGEIFAFLGPNGAGKTTTVKILTTLLRPSSGYIRIAGFDPVAQPLQVRRLFGIVFQDCTLDGEMTVGENMEMHAALFGVTKQRSNRIHSLLNLVGLDDRQNEFVKKLSGGLKRRLEIARALLHEPKVLFLDEPTLGLDPQGRNAIWDHLELIRQERKITIFFTTHYMDEAERMADRVAIIDHGKIVAMGTPEQIMANADGESLEDAFITLTGRNSSDVEADGSEGLRVMQKVWRQQ
jgi:ABC-2 type transport system ATP-binding protein